MVKVLFLFLTFLFFPISVPYAITINVPGDYSTIQDGLNAAESGDTVLVAPGVYYENVEFITDWVTLLSSVQHAATIDASGSGHVVSLNNKSGVVDGFVITGSGGGYYTGVFTSQKMQVIRNNIITDNDGGISISSGSIALVSGNTVLNSQDEGIRIRTGAKAIVTRNLIENNNIGIDCSTPGPVYIINNTIVNQEVWNLVFSETVATVSNNIITNAEIGILFGGFYHPNITEYVGQFLTISYNDVYQHSFSNYYASLGSYPEYISGPFQPLPGTGEIHANPLFINPDEYDFNLQIDSPCIDAGDPSSENIPWGGFWRDMGTFEYDQGFYFDGQNIICKPILFN